jgi:hypothetical protein
LGAELFEGAGEKILVEGDGNGGRMWSDELI